MELVLQRISPIALSWAFFAVLGFAVSVLTLILLRFILEKQVRLKNVLPEIIDMIKHNMLAEAIRFAAYVIAVLLIVFYLFGLVGGDWIGWLLVGMLAAFVANSLNEFFTMLGLLRD